MSDELENNGIGYFEYYFLIEMQFSESNLVWVVLQVVGVFLFICFLVYVFYTGHIPGQTLWSQVSAASLADLKQGVVAQSLTEADFNVLKNK